jgi:Tol biopolymer transport system component
VQVKALLPADAIWVFAGGRVVALAPGSPSINLKEKGSDFIGNPGDVQVAPDASMLAYTGLVQSPGMQQVILVDLRSGKRQALHPGMTSLGAHFSPDGRSLAYTLTESTSKGHRWQLLVRDLVSGATRTLQKGESQEPEMLVPNRWTTNGLFAQESFEATRKLSRVDPTTGALQILYEPNFARAEITADGRKAALLLGPLPLDSDIEPDATITVLDTSTRRETPLVRHAKFWASNLRWSPNGAKLLYTVQSKFDQPVTELHIRNADGSGEQKLVIGKGGVSGTFRDVAWKDDSSILLLMLDSKKVLHVYQAALNNLNPSALKELGTVQGSTAPNLFDEFVHVPR